MKYLFPHERDFPGNFPVRKDSESATENRFKGKRLNGEALGMAHRDRCLSPEVDDGSGV